MTTELILVLALIFFAAAVPLTLVAALACLYLFPSAPWATGSVARIGLGGIIGTALCLATFFVPLRNGDLSWPETIAICATGFSGGSIVGWIVSAVPRRVFVKAGLAGLTFVIANALALLSVFIERTGPEMRAYGNMCGPTGSDLCFKPALKGGFPLAYLIDVPGVSVEHHLFFGQDDFYLGAFAFDVAFYFAAMLFVAWFTSRGLRRIRRSG